MRKLMQFSLSPSAVKILERWVDRFGEGTRSLHVDMAIHHAERSGIFAVDQGEPMSLEDAVQKHGARLIERTLRTLTGQPDAPGPGK